MKRLAVLLVVLGLVLTAFAAPATARKGPRGPQGEGDPNVLALMHRINKKLAGQGLNIAIEEIEVFTIGAGRPLNRIHQEPFRWVPNDARRAADGDNITYLVDQSDGATASGLSTAQTEAAIDRALGTWNGTRCLSTVSVVKRGDSGADPDIFDSFFPPFPPFGNPFLADIVNAGWLPRAFFEDVTEDPDNVVAFSVTFIFADGGVPTDIDGDNHLDTALNEVYYNDTFGTPGEPRAGFPWGIDVGLPGIDVETGALHENGHSLGVGHFGPPPDAVMNPVYSGVRQSPSPIDEAGMCTVWSRWPSA